jgi:hypothetical protein
MVINKFPNKIDVYRVVSPWIFSFFRITEQTLNNEKKISLALILFYVNHVYNHRVKIRGGRFKIENSKINCFS